MYDVIREFPKTTRTSICTPGMLARIKSAIKLSFWGVYASCVYYSITNYIVTYSVVS